MKLVKEMVLCSFVLAFFLIGCASAPDAGNETLTGDVIADPEPLSSDPLEPGDSPDELSEVMLLPLQAAKLSNEYDASRYEDCGVYTRRNNDIGNVGDYSEVYVCMKDASRNCNDGKAFIDVQTKEGARVVSFISTDNCKISNHIKGNDPYGFAGEDLKTCDALDPNLALQYTCIGYDFV